MYVLLKFKFVIVVVVVQFFALFGKAQAIEATREPMKVSTLNKLSDVEVEALLAEYLGKQDTWKTERTLLQRALALNPFKRKKTLQMELSDIAQLSRSTQADSLQVVATAIANSQHPDVRNILTVIQGDKRLALPSAARTPGFNPKFFLSFLQYLHAGKFESQHKKYLPDFSASFSQVASNLERSLTLSQKLGIPVIVEFESSALMSKSPLTLLLFNTIVKNANVPEQLIKAETTRSGGRIISLSPNYAEEVVDNVERFAKEFRSYANSLFSRYSNDSPRERERIVDLLRDGVGLSSIFYSEDRLQEIEAQHRARKGHSKTCIGLFN